MSAKVWSAALLGALVAAGLAGSADAAAKRMKNQQVYVAEYLLAYSGILLACSISHPVTASPP